MSVFKTKRNKASTYWSFQTFPFFFFKHLPENPLNLCSKNSKKKENKKQKPKPWEFFLCSICIVQPHTILHLKWMSIQMPPALHCILYINLYCIIIEQIHFCNPCFNDFSLTNTKHRIFDTFPRTFL